jgi:hypothetical protein
MHPKTIKFVLNQACPKLLATPRNESDSEAYWNQDHVVPKRVLFAA